MLSFTAYSCALSCFAVINLSLHVSTFSPFIYYLYLYFLLVCALSFMRFCLVSFFMFIFCLLVDKLENIPFASHLYFLIICPIPKKIYKHLNKPCIVKDP